MNIKKRKLKKQEDKHPPIKKKTRKKNEKKTQNLQTKTRKKITHSCWLYILSKFANECQSQAFKTNKSQFTIHYEYSDLDLFFSSVVHILVPS